MESKQKIGIICDSYKTEMFKEELAKADIEIVSISPLMKGVDTITVFSYQRLVKPITDKVTQYFIDLYKKQN